ncbi:MAG: TonB-dependent receptor [Ignavibacteriaceae bacterium]|jgi:outer membrane receptor for ferrienterochelin and colicin
MEHPRSRNILNAALLILSFVALLNASLIGQNKTGTISGEVRDAVTKQPLLYANISIVGTQLGTVTDEKGYFVIKNIVPEVYQLKISYIGYISTIKEDITVIHSRNTSVFIELRPSQIEMSEVSVTGGYFQKPIDQSISIRSLTQQEIRRSPGSAEDIFRVMQSLPGVASAGGKSAQLIVRGGSPDENLTLLDNIEIYNPIHFARTGESMGIVSIINPSLLKGVDFMTGGFPAKYGDKMSSVFEMSLVDGNKEMYNTDINVNLGGFGAMVDGPVPGNGTMIFSARRGFFDLLTSLLNKPAAPQYYDAVAKLTYDLDEKNRISIVGFYYLDQIIREGTSTTKKTASEATNFKYDYLTRDDYGTAFGTNWRYLFSPKAFSLTTLSFSGNGWNTLQGTETDRSLSGEEIRENSFDIKNEVTLNVLANLELKAGGYLRFIDSKHTAWKPADTTRTGQIIPASSISFLPEMSNKVSIFLQNTWRPFARFSLTSGVRYDYFSFTKEGNVSPRLSFSYYLTDKTSFNASFGKFYQTPAAYQIALDPLNVLLKSSLATHYIVGVDHLFAEDTKFTVELYHKDLTNVFVANDTTDVLTNAGEGFAQGIEFSLQKKFIDGIVGSASYSYAASKRKDASNLSEYYFEYDRTHIFNLLGGFELSKTWQIGFKFQYASGNPYTPATGVATKNGINYVIDGVYNSARLPDYHKLDIRIDKKFIFENWTLTAYLDLWNVYNRQNVLSYSSKVDATGIITTTPRFDFGILPILGLSAQF